MKIAVIGSGNVGSALGCGWAGRGHEVVFGVRDPASAKVATVVERAPGSRAAGVSEAARASEVVVLTTPWGDATQQAVKACGDLASKPVLDCTNPLTAGLTGLSIGLDSSAGEQVQAWAPAAHVVKIFNTTGADNMQDPDYAGQAATMFYCGDSEGAKKIAGSLAADLGFEPVDVGPLSQARVLEPLAMLWISMAMRYGFGRDIAFKLLRR